MGTYRSAEYHTHRAGFDEVVRETGLVRELQHGEHAAFDLNAFDFEPLAEPRPTLAGDITVRWDLMFRTPNGATYGVIDAKGDGIEGRELFLVRPSAEPNQPAELLRRLYKDDMVTAGGPNGVWMTGIGVTREGGLILAHSGEGVTEITGALSGNMAEQEPFPPEMWAPAPWAIRDSLHGGR
jgi:hypothetical protein